MSLQRWSYSSIKEFEQCASKYHHLRILKDFTSESGPEAQQGTQDHEALEAHLLTGAHLPEHLAARCGALLRVIQAHIDRGARLLVEHEMGMSREYRAVPYADAWGRGKADVILLSDLDTDGANPLTAHIFDWKSGKVRHDPAQLRLYSWMLWLQYPSLQRVFYRYLWYNFNHITPVNGDADAGYMDKAAIFKFAQEWIQRVKKVESRIASGIFVPTASGLCPWCPVTKEVCVAKRDKWERR